MYEINFLVWPVVYGFAGHFLGSMWGHPWIGAIVGVVLGIMTAVPMISALFYDVEILAPLVLFISFFLPRSVRLWVLGGLVALPWVRLGWVVWWEWRGRRRGKGDGSWVMAGYRRATPITHPRCNHRLAAGIWKSRVA